MLKFFCAISVSYHNQVEVFDEIIQYDRKLINSMVLYMHISDELVPILTRLQLLLIIIKAYI